MIIDAHMHIGKLYVGERPLRPSMLLRFMDAHGIDRAALLPIESPEETHYYVTTDYVLRICRRYPDRFIPFCCVDPRHGSGNSVEIARRKLAEYACRGCRGYGEAMTGLFIDDPRLMGIYEACGELGLVVTYHIDGLRNIDERGFPRFDRVLRTFPRTIFVGHAQHFWAEVSGDVTEDQFSSYPKGPVAPGGATIRLFETYPNLCADLSAGSGYNALTRDPAFGYAFLERFQDRLMFGTDLCRNNQEIAIIPYLRDAVATGRISREAYEKIMWRNAVRLLRLEAA